MFPFRLLLYQGVGEGAIPFPGLLHFTLGSEPRSPGPLANTLTIMPMSG